MVRQPSSSSTSSYSPRILRRRTTFPPVRRTTTTMRFTQTIPTVILFLSWSSSTSFTYAAAAATTPDLFDQFDRNQDHMIDRTEYERGIPQLLSQLQLLTTPNTQSNSFTTWLMKDVFSYGSSSSSSSATTDEVSADHLPMITTTTTSIWSGFGKAFTSSVLMILATEIGDKTFFIAAILSMKHSRTLVFTGALLALVVMTIISTAMGLILPKFLNRTYTHFLSGLLFLYFGCKLLYDSRSMEHKVSEELEEVEEELLHQPTKKNKKKGDDDDIESAGGHNNNNSHSSTAVVSALSSSYSILVMALTLTFVAEWGDRSQIATIALASAKNPMGVTLGAIMGHAICTATACIGGRILASNISEKMVSQFGGVIFLLFGLHSLFFES